MEPCYIGGRPSSCPVQGKDGPERVEVALGGKHVDIRASLHNLAEMPLASVRSAHTSLTVRSGACRVQEGWQAQECRES